MSEFSSPEHSSETEEPILVEFAVSRGGLQQVSRGSQSDATLAARSTKAVDRAMNTIEHMAQRTITTLDKLSNQPSEVEISFAITLDAETGALLAKMSTQGTLQVKLVWKREKADGKNK